MLKNTKLPLPNFQSNFMRKFSPNLRQYNDRKSCFYAMIEYFK